MMKTSKRLPQAPRYSRTLELAVSFMQNERISYFPIDPSAIIKRHGWRLKTYTWLAHTEGIYDPLTILQMTRYVLGSEDAVVFKKGDQYLIAYNEHTRPNGRINFSLMHEIGHIVLGHLDDYPCGQMARDGLTDAEYRVLEDEANCFACNALTPAILALQLKSVFTATVCQKVFGLSRSAWSTRVSLISRDYALIPKPMKESQKQQYWGFVTSKICANCGSKILGLRKGSHCPFCGSQDLRWRNDTMKYEDVYHLDDSGRPNKCPVCDNEDIGEGEYCKICGALIINRCTNYHDLDYPSADECGRSADGKARYCIYCGAETTYLRNGYLEPWDKNKKPKPPINAAKSNNDDFSFK